MADSDQDLHERKAVGNRESRSRSLRRQTSSHIGDARASAVANRHSSTKSRQTFEKNLDACRNDVMLEFDDSQRRRNCRRNRVVVSERCPRLRRFGIDAGSVTTNRAPPPSSLPSRHAAVVRHDNFLHEGEAETSSLGLGREERPEHAFEDVVGNAGAVVADADAQHAVHSVPAGLRSTIRGTTRA